VFSEATARASIKLVRTFREQGIAAEIYPDYKVKLDKQLKYADKLHIPYVVLLGPEEVSAGAVTLKNLLSGEQKKLSIDETIQLIRP
jgi:histidyl-tRNA synthetase